MRSGTTRSYSLDAAQVLAALTERQVRIGAAQARALLAPFVEDVIDGLCRYGLPYLDECLAAPWATPGIAALSSRAKATSAAATGFA